MELFERLCPAPPNWTVLRAEIAATFTWVRRLTGVAQDPVHHAEGDVATHTRMACEALAALPEWRARPADEIARRVLWELGAPAAWREHVTALVRHHQIPFWALERPDLDRIVFRVSLLARNDDLALLATADIRGRVCDDADEVCDDIALFQEYCAERDCLDRPRQFPSDHARFWYFRTPGRDPDYAAYDDSRLTVTILSGLPGVGKDHWIARHRPGWPVVSLDALRGELGIKPTEDQRPVVAAAHTPAREHLRTGRPFVWNATNVSRRLREQCIDLVAGYRGRVELIALEAPPQVLQERNRARPQPVPDAVIDRLVDRWETPDPTEAHTVEWINTD